MNLSYYIGILWRRKWIIIATTLVTVGVVAFGTTRLSSTYVATTTLRISTVVSGSADYFQYDLLYSNRLMRTYAQLATSRPILEAMVTQLELDPYWFPEIDTQILEDTELLEISVTHEDPIIARDTANFIGNALVEYNDWQNNTGSALENNNQSLGRPTTSIISPAVTPEEAIRANARLFIIMGGLVGFVGGIGLALVMHNLDTRIYTSEGIQEIMRQPILGEIPQVRRLRKKKIMLNIDTCAEAFRWLYSNLLATRKEQNLRTLLITSAEPEEGKSLITANLAVIMGQSNMRVVVVDADLRRPTQHGIFGLDNNSGLSAILQNNAPLEDVLQPTTFPGVTVLTSGKPNVDPSQILHVVHVAELLDELSEQYDMVLVDTPASLAVADAAVLAPLADGVLVVTRHAHLREKTLQTLRDQLDKVNALVLGVVINRSRQGTYYHRYYSSRNKNILKIVPADKNVMGTRTSKKDMTDEVTRPVTPPRANRPLDHHAAKRGKNDSRS